MDNKIQNRTEKYQNELLTLKQQYDVECSQHKILQQKFNQQQKKIVQYENELKESKNKKLEIEHISNIKNKNFNNLQNELNKKNSELEEWKLKHDKLSNVLKETLNRMSDKIKEQSLENYATVVIEFNKKIELYKETYQKRYNDLVKDCNERLNNQYELNKKQYNKLEQNHLYILDYLHQIRHIIPAEYFCVLPKVLQQMIIKGNFDDNNLDNRDNIIIINNEYF